MGKIRVITGMLGDHNGSWVEYGEYQLLEKQLEAANNLIRTYRSAAAGSDAEVAILRIQSEESLKRADTLEFYFRTYTPLRWEKWEILKATLESADAN
jgi:hypothetical protein